MGSSSAFWEVYLSIFQKIKTQNGYHKEQVSLVVMDSFK